MLAFLVSNFTASYNAIYRPDEIGRSAGYVLHITNLAKADITFGIESLITEHYFGMAATTDSVPTTLQNLLGKTWREAGGSFYRNYETRRIPAGGSSSYMVKPPVWQGQDWIMEVHGHVSMHVPVLHSMTFPYELAPQYPDPVPVLLSAWRDDSSARTRAPGSNLHMEITWQTAVQLATGKAYNEIPPDTSIFEGGWASRTLADAKKREIAPTDVLGALSLDENDAAQALVDLLAQLGDDPNDIEAVNRALREVRAPVSVQLNRGQP